MGFLLFIERWVERTLSVCAALVLLGMTVMIFLDVFARYLFNAAVYGRGELIEFMMALLVFLLLPVVSRDRAHIQVSLIDGWFRGSWRTLHKLVIDVTSLLVLGGMAYALWGHAALMQLFEARTQVLKWPEAPVIYLLAVLSALGSAFMLYTLARLLRHGPDAEAH